MQVLVFLRLWRVIRFLNSIVQSVELALKDAENTLDNRNVEINRLDEKLGLLKFQLSKEKEDMEQMEETFQAQRQQVPLVAALLEFLDSSF